MTSIQKLDVVLKFLSTQKPLYVKPTIEYTLNKIIELYPELKQENNFIDELTPILKKLLKDGYVNYERIVITKSNIDIKISHADCYGITFEGMYFIEGGGYQEQHRLVNLEKDHQKQMALYQLKLTKIAAYGAASIVIWEIVKYFLFDHHWYFHPY